MKCPPTTSSNWYSGHVDTVSQYRSIHMSPTLKIILARPWLSPISLWLRLGFWASPLRECHAIKDDTQWSTNSSTWLLNILCMYVCISALESLPEKKWDSLLLGLAASTEWFCGPTDQEEVPGAAAAFNQWKWGHTEHNLWCNCRRLSYAVSSGWIGDARRRRGDGWLRVGVGFSVVRGIEEDATAAATQCEEDVEPETRGYDKLNSWKAMNE